MYFFFKSFSPVVLSNYFIFKAFPFSSDKICKHKYWVNWNIEICAFIVKINQFTGTPKFLSNSRQVHIWPNRFTLKKVTLLPRHFKIKQKILFWNFHQLNKMVFPVCIFELYFLNPSGWPDILQWAPNVMSPHMKGVKVSV